MMDGCINDGWMEAWMDKQAEEINKGKPKKLAWVLEMSPSLNP